MWCGSQHSELLRTGNQVYTLIIVHIRARQEMLMFHVIIRNSHSVFVYFLNKCSCLSGSYFGMIEPSPIFVM